MKKMFMTALAFLVLASHSFAGNNSLVQTAVEDYLYSTEVEGKSLSEAATDFKHQMLQSGLSKKEQLTGIAASMKDQQAKETLSQVLATVDAQKLTDGEAYDLMMEALKSHSSQGASWNGDFGLTMWWVIAIGILATMILAGNSPEQVCAETAIGDYLDVRGDKYFWVRGEHCVRWEDKQ